MDWDKKKEFLMARIYQTGRVKKNKYFKNIPHKNIKNLKRENLTFILEQQFKNKKNYQEQVIYEIFQKCL